MSEFFLELFTEEIPTNLQNSSREVLLRNFKKLFEDNHIKFKKSLSLSTPNRLTLSFEGLVKEITKKAEEIKGPSVNAPEKAIEGFVRSNQINKGDLFKKIIEKGEFYFFKKSSKKISTVDLLQEQVPLILDRMSWKKSMRWGNYNFYWARPLKSIMGIFDGKCLNFNFYHLSCSNTTFVDREFEDKKKYLKILRNIINFLIN